MSWDLSKKMQTCDKIQASVSNGSEMKQIQLFKYKGLAQVLWPSYLFAARPASPFEVVVLVSGNWCT